MQLSFWGYDAEGNGQNSGHRIVYVYRDSVRRDKLKIGFTKCEVKRRIRAQQTGNPDDFEFVGSFVVRDDQNDRDIHRMLAKFHYRREWFNDCPELMAILNRLFRNPVVFRIPQDKFTPPPPNGYCQWTFSLGCPSCRELLFFGCEINNAEDVEQARLSIGKCFHVTCGKCSRRVYVEFEYA